MKKSGSYLIPGWMCWNKRSLVAGIKKGDADSARRLGRRGDSAGAWRPKKPRNMKSR